jgi:3',5'-nucleoside bisphosphate phosphatase
LAEIRTDLLSQDGSTTRGRSGYHPALVVIDLQSHSTVSDGQLPPADVARSAVEAGVTVMALTDHDGIAGVAAATAVASRAGILNVPAVEMSCVHKYSEDLHICGYWVDTERIRPACERAQAERVERANEIIANLNRHGVDVTFEGAVAQAGAADAIGRPHIARAAGAGPDLGPFFEEYLVPGAKAFVSRKWPTADQAVELIHDAGGVAVVAHPYWDVKEPAQVRDLVESLVHDVGLDGIESFYPPHTAAQTRHCLALCEEFGLVATASSDFHGPTHRQFSRWGAYDTYGLGEPQVPERPAPTT